MSSFAMAGRCPKARYYPGVNSLAIFSAQGSNPLQDCKVHGKGVAKVYDKSVKGYVYSITGGLQSKLQLPKDDSKIGLQLLQPFLVLQLFVPQGVHFSVELRVSDINNTHRKMYFSTSFSEVKSTPLHCQIPISMVIRNKWISLAFHVADLFNSCFRGGGGMNFRSIDVIVLGPVCKLRKIFTMRCRIIETDPKGYLVESREDAGENSLPQNSLPQEHTYASGVDTCIQTFDMASIQLAMACNNETQHDHDYRSGPESGLSARKQNQPSKAAENIKSVHVAFGTRMPLPLSTVHINTNLPHDKCPTLVKDRIGKVHFVSDPAAAATAIATGGGGGGGGEREASKLPSNMITRALNVASLDRERRNSVESGESRFMLRTNRTGQTTRWCGEEKEQVTNTAHTITVNDGGDVVDGDGEHPMKSAKECEFQAPSQEPVGLPNSPKIGANQHVSTNAEGSVGGVDSGSITSTNKSPSKWVPRKRDVQMSTTHLKQQKSKEQRNKEYKHSRYMDSPPGSPPCGWDHNVSTTGGRTTQLGDIVFHDHFLEGSWMNNQFSESIDAGNKPYCLANSLKEKILSSMPHSLSTRLDEEAMTMVDSVNHRDESSKTINALHDQYHQISRSTEWETSFEGPASSTGSKSVTNRDIGTDPGHYNCEDTEAISASYGDYQSWSSGSSSVVPGDALHEFEPRSLSRGNADADAAAQKFGGGGTQSSKTSDLQSCLPTSLLLAKDSEKRSQHEEDDTLMFDIQDDRFFPGHPASEKRKETNELETRSTADRLFPAIEGKGFEESSDFDAEPDASEKADSSPQDTDHEMKTSSDFGRFTMDPSRIVRTSDTVLASWQEPDSDEHHSCHISSGAAQRLVDQEPAGPLKPSGRPDEDLDLLYDPTLDCYYDPKTNRYYELK